MNSRYARVVVVLNALATAPLATAETISARASPVSILFVYRRFLGRALVNLVPPAHRGEGKIKTRQKEKDRHCKPSLPSFLRFLSVDSKRTSEDFSLELK